MREVIIANILDRCCCAPVYIVNPVSFQGPNCNDLVCYYPAPQCHCHLGGLESSRKNYIAYSGRVLVIPGEHEPDVVATGILRVNGGEEDPREYDPQEQVASDLVLNMGRAARRLPVAPCLVY